MKLYGNPKSGNTFRVRLVGRELDASLETEWLDIPAGDNRKPEYLKLNAMGKIPTLEDEGFALWESRAICLYLASKYPEKGLLPTDPRGKADVERWLFWDASHMATSIGLLHRERVMKKLFGQGEPDPGVVAHAEAEAKRFLKTLDDALAGKEWLVGGKPSLADFSVGASLAGKQQHYDTAAYPNVARWLGQLQSRMSWKMSWPTGGLM